MGLLISFSREELNPQTEGFFTLQRWLRLRLWVMVGLVSVDHNLSSLQVLASIGNQSDYPCWL